MTENQFSANPVMLLSDLKGPSEYIDSLFDRFEFYGKLVLETSESKHSGLTVMLPSIKAKVFTVSNVSNHVTLVEIPHPMFRPFRFYRSIINEFKSEEWNPSTFILAHPYKSFFLIQAIQLLSRRKFRFQVQFHGHIFEKPRHRSILARAKYFSLMESVRAADSVRFASHVLLNDFKSKANLGEINSLVAPIPIDFRKIPATRMSIPFTVGIIGRMQEERGVREALEIALAVVREQPRAKFIFVGDGPMEKEIRNFLDSNMELSSSRLEHFLDNKSLQAYYSELSALLSCAPSEGYGLTIREAALSGIQVLARKSQGADIASQEFPDQIQIYTLPEEAVSKLISIFDSSQVATGLAEARINQANRDLESSIRLVKSWL
jgi:glycosyltransferase involved in cell wall biosynthesis